MYRYYFLIKTKRGNITWYICDTLVELVGYLFLNLQGFLNKHGTIIIEKILIKPNSKE